MSTFLNLRVIMSVSRPRSLLSAEEWAKTALVPEWMGSQVTYEDAYDKGCEHYSVEDADIAMHLPSLGAIGEAIDEAGKKPLFEGDVWVPYLNFENSRDWVYVGSSEKGILGKSHRELFGGKLTWSTMPSSSQRCRGWVLFELPHADEELEPDVEAKRTDLRRRLIAAALPAAAAATKGASAAASAAEPVATGSSSSSGKAAPISASAPRVAAASTSSSAAAAPASGGAGGASAASAPAAPAVCELGGGTTWAAADAAAKKAGNRLASQAEVQAYIKSKGGKPLKAADAWTPVSDAPNEWVSIGGQYPERLGKTHTQVAGSKPDWGSKAGEQPWRGTVLMR